MWKVLRWRPGGDKNPDSGSHKLRVSVPSPDKWGDFVSKGTWDKINQTCGSILCGNQLRVAYIFWYVQYFYAWTVLEKLGRIHSSNSSSSCSSFSSYSESRCISSSAFKPTCSDWLSKLWATGGWGFLALWDYSDAGEGKKCNKLSFQSSLQLSGVAVQMLRLLLDVEDVLFVPCRWFCLDSTAQKDASPSRRTHLENIRSAFTPTPPSSRCLPAACWWGDTQTYKRELQQFIPFCSDPWRS